MTIRYVLWHQTVRVHNFNQQVAAAAAGGFDVLSIPHSVYRNERAAGRSARELLTFAADHGVQLDFLDGVSGWTPYRYPVGADAYLRSLLDYSLEEGLETCEALGLKNILAIGCWEPGALSYAEIVDLFGRLCDKAAAAGIWVDLESSATRAALPKLRSAWDVVRDAGGKNAGVLLDTWHFARTDPDLDFLAGIPRGRIVNVQLADGTKAPRHAVRWEEARRYRVLAGQGELPIVDMLRALRRNQDLRSVGPEAMSDELDMLPALAAGRLAGQTTRAVMADAGYPSN